IKYKKLGLLIIDEEHRFGVRHKDKLRKMKSNVDTLYMSATPIPRTMYMALSKLKELSLIRTSPKARLPIRTVIVPWDKDVIKDAIAREVDRGGQVFFVHNRVQTIDSIVTELRKLLPNVTFGVGHGQLPERQLEAVTLDFAHHKFDVLVATTIIESGIDIPNANTIIVNRSDMFGLAQLYQIRGRVGRSNRRAYAYLIIPPKMQEDARRRLETLIEYESLGSGYQIAMRDMELRGAGSLLGTKQSGVINSIGFNYYNRLLSKAIENIQAEKPKAEWIEDEPQKLERIRIESDHYFPESYISSEKERLEIYRKMLAFTSKEQYEALEQELKDRFGSVPEQANTAIQYYKLRMLTSKAGLESLKMKKGNVILEFENKKLPARSKMMQLVERFKYPVKFDTIKNFKMSFEIFKDKDDIRFQLLEKSLEIVEYYLSIS
ncbi:MAG TPA: transcription-repair coupling factor, partial [Bacteroidetes bacterium]|nr:transcription-repair coupling factor [Bacteroidota bacterium]